ncbi:MAG: transcriptional regulator [Proteobacteria bacterium]|nr:MAG: transcriptional regulator [Pseudomonadota bacterium]
MMTPAPNRDVLSFGPFNLVANERLLTRNGAPVELGARSLDILMALLSKPNKVISKKDLLAQVWPDVIVEESSLRFHIASLRKALGDGKSGARYITTLAGRGYCFVAPISRASGQVDMEAVVRAPFPHANLPNRLVRMVGRDNDVLRISGQLTAKRFVSIVGSGGVGKTTVAVAVGHHLAEAFAGAVLFVDLGMLSNPDLVATAVASMLGLSVQSDDATPSLIAHLRKKRIILILDTCEHLVEAVATLAASIITAAPDVHILATSREPLQVEGEYVHRLDALACPPDESKLTAAALQQFPATQLFVDRAVASGARLDLNDADAAVVVGICRRLDGVALAIELAARRVESYGLQQTAALLDQRLTLLWVGPRTAPPRQKTLQATLDWSYGLLSDVERAVLRRLAVFVGHFTLDAALAVVTSATVDQALVFGAIDSLVTKSMVATRPIGAMMRYRLLDTTRAYALDTSIDDAEAAELAVRHATYYRRWLEQTEAEWPTLPAGTERAPYFAGLNNARAALEWCFGQNGEVKVGIELAAAAAPVFLAMSLLSECRRWSERALLALDERSRGGREEMQLQASLGLALMFTRGHSDAAIAALERSVAIANARGDLLTEVRLLGPLHMYHVRGGDFKLTLGYAKRSAEIARTLGDAGATALAHALLGISLHLMGDLHAARVELEAAIETGPGSPASRTIYFGFDHHSWADMVLTTTLWLQGYPAQALAGAHEAIKYAERMHHPVSLGIVLNSIQVLLWIGDLSTAEEHLDWFLARAEAQSFGPYLDLGLGLKGELAIRRGEVKAGVEMLQNCLEKLRATRYERFTTRFNMMLARGLAASGRSMEGVTLMNETLELIEAKGGTTYLPEVLRLKGSILLAMPNPRIEDAEACFRQSLELSRAHGSRAWELRTATDLAELWAGQGRSDDARALLLPVFAQFTEGADTADLEAAEHLLTTLRQHTGAPPTS